MECKLSSENTRLKKELEDLEKRHQEDRKWARETRDSEGEWFRKFEDYMREIMGYDYEGQVGFDCFEGALIFFMRDYCRTKGTELPKRLINYACESYKKKYGSSEASVSFGDKSSCEKLCKGFTNCVLLKKLK